MSSPGQQRRKAASLKRSSQDNHVDRVANGILIIACTANAGAAASIHSVPSQAGPGLQDIELARISQEVTERFYNLLAAGEGERCPSRVCAVTRRRFPVGASPTRQPLQPEATGALPSGVAPISTSMHSALSSIRACR